MNRFFGLLLLLFMPLGTALAHIGSSGVIVQKQAGRYQVLVSVTPPDVVPGTARVTVYVERGRVSTVRARPVFFYAGDEGAPTYDDLSASAANPRQYEGIVWLMQTGSSSIELSLDGPDRRETVVVPVVSIATAQRDLPAGMGAILAGLALLLFVLMVTIIGASLSDGTLRPGQPAPASFRRKRLIGMSAAAVILALVLTGGRSWWNSWADEYRTQTLYKPLTVHSSVTTDANQARLTIAIDTTNGKDRLRRLSYLVPDHGKLMHLFLVRLPGLDVFAHLHPARLDTLHYQSQLANLPSGEYRLYADVVSWSGFAETLTDTVTLRVPAHAAPLTDPDDSFLRTTAVGQKPGYARTPTLDQTIARCGTPGTRVALADGSTMAWSNQPNAVLRAGQLYKLRFTVADSAGRPAQLEPYLGMGGHAAIIHTDGSVYIHLHPVGTYSMAAEESMLARIADTTRTLHYPTPKRFRDSIDTYLASLKAQPSRSGLSTVASLAMNHPMAGMNHDDGVEFPYAFPKAGQYRVWVQVKRKGRVLTGVFDTEVKEDVL